MSTPVTPREPVPRGTRVGRYIVLDAMPGEASYRAYDRELGRRIVLERLPRGDGSTAALNERERMLKQARALAPLSHPNVRAVYDIGTLGEEIFVAVELVAGKPLRAWLTDTRRSWRQIVAVFREIAAGLAAIHEAGVERCGFAPERVIVGDDGRVSVAGFGAEASAGSSDRHAFSAALHEALYGGVASRRRVPGWLRILVQRGLSAGPEQQAPSMAALHAELSKDRGAPGRALLALAAVLLLIAATIGAVTYPRTQRVRARRVTLQQLSGVWDDAQRTKIRAGFVAAKGPGAVDTYQRLEKVLDDYAREWVNLRMATWEASQGTGAQSELLLDRRMGCLRARLSALEALTTVLSDAPDDDVVTHAIPAAVGLPMLASCADADALLAAFPPPSDPGLRARVEELDKLLDRAEALRAAGKYTSALELTRTVTEQAGALAYPRLIAKATALAGLLQDDVGDAKAAEATLLQGLTIAARAKDDALVAKVWLGLIWTIGFSSSRIDEATELGAPAEAAILRAGGDPVAFAELQNHLGVVYWAGGRAEEARACHERALALREGIFGDRHPVFAKSLTNLAAVYNVRGDYLRAVSLYRRALEITEQVLGGDHPDVGRSHLNLGAVLLDMGEYAEARIEVETGIDIFRRSLGPNHFFVAAARVDLGKVLLRQGHPREAIDEERFALEAFEKSLGPNHRYVVEALSPLAESLLATGRAAEAIPVSRRLLAIYDSRPTAPEDRAAAEFLLARELWESKIDPAGALRLASGAEQALARAGSAAEIERKKIAAWIATHGARVR
jgi:tetratricopeptide (TPR) repeat protein